MQFDCFLSSQRTLSIIALCGKLSHKSVYDTHFPGARRTSGEIDSHWNVWLRHASVEGSSEVIMLRYAQGRRDGGEDRIVSGEYETGGGGRNLRLSAPDSSSLGVSCADCDVCAAKTLYRDTAHVCGILTATRLLKT